MGIHCMRLSGNIGTILAFCLCFCVWLKYHDPPPHHRSNSSTEKKQQVQQQNCRCDSELTRDLNPCDCQLDRFDIGVIIGVIIALIYVQHRRKQSECLLCLFKTKQTNSQTNNNNNNKQQSTESCYSFTVQHCLNFNR